MTKSKWWRGVAVTVVMALISLLNAIMVIYCISLAAIATWEAVSEETWSGSWWVSVVAAVVFVVLAFGNAYGILKAYNRR